MGALGHRRYPGNHERRDKFSLFALNVFRSVSKVSEGFHRDPFLRLDECDYLSHVAGIVFLEFVHSRISVALFPMSPIEIAI